MSKKSMNEDIEQMTILEKAEILKKCCFDWLFELGSCQQQNGTFWENKMRAVERTFDEIILELKKIETKNQPLTTEEIDRLTNDDIGIEIFEHAEYKDNHDVVYVAIPYTQSTLEDILPHYGIGKTEDEAKRHMYVQLYKLVKEATSE